MSSMEQLDTVYTKKDSVLRRSLFCEYNYFAAAVVVVVAAVVLPVVAVVEAPVVLATVVVVVGNMGTFFSLCCQFVRRFYGNLFGFWLAFGRCGAVFRCSGCGRVAASERIVFRRVIFS